MELKEGYVICNSDIKQSILKSQNEFKNLIFLTLNELKEKIFFKIPKKAIKILMDKYNFSYELALEYIDAVKKIQNNNYNNVKLDGIVSVYNFLNDNNLIIKDELFKYRLKQYPLTFINPEYSKEYKIIKEEVLKYTECYELNYVDSKYKPLVYEFKTILDEGLWVFNEIIKLLNSGVNANNIYIINSDDEYEHLFKRLSKSYNISFNFKPVKNILSTKIAKHFIEQCYRCESFEELFSKLDSSNNLYNKITNTINEYELMNYKPVECVEIIKEIFKNISFDSVKYVQAVQFGSIDYILNDDEYAFYVGFNLGTAPKINKESGFLNDSDLQLLGYSTSYDLNSIAYDRVIKFITSNKNVKISFKHLAKTDEYLPSLLIKMLNLETIKEEALFGYSKIEDNLRLARYYDEYLKYGNMSANLKRFGLNGIKYKTYNHKYKQIPESILKERFSAKKLKLAYSNIKLYFACPFSYYADRILGLNEFEPQMAARLGSFSHGVLEDSYSSDFNFEQSVIKNKVEHCEDLKDEFFFNQMEDVLRGLISFNNQHEKESELNNIKLEEHITVVKDEYQFEGYIDKLLYKIDGNDVYAAIIDYKTGKDIVSLDNITDGFHLQLPSYMYLLNNYEPFKGLNLHIIGIYLQKVNIVIFDNKSDIEKQRAKNFMLEGFTVSDINLIKRFDPSFVKSTYIKSLSMTNSGFSQYAKLFKSEDQNKIIKITEDLLENGARGILNGNFKIEPKMIKGKNESCMFCKYKDICFYDYSDIVELEYKPFGKEK